MKGFFKIAIILFVSLIMIACSQRQTVVHDLEGNAIDLTNHPHKWLFINYWAVWCEPCKKEIPELNIFYRRHHDQVEIYGYEYDRLSLEKLKTISHRMGIEYKVLQEDPARSLGLSDIVALPTTFVFNPEGKLVKTLSGPQTEASLMEAMSEE